MAKQEKEKILLIAGCSHAAGSEIDGTEDSEYNRNFSYGSQLAISLGYRPINICMLGATNSSISRSVLKYVDSTYDPKTMDLGVLICWTESNRIEIPWDEDTSTQSGKHNNRANWFDQSANDFYTIVIGNKGSKKKEREACRYFHHFIADNQTLMELNTINHILMMQYYLKHKNLKYLMCNSMQTITHYNHHIGYYTGLIDNTHYMGYTAMANENFYWKYRDAGYTNPKARYWHHDETPHKLFAGELFHFNEDNKCL